MPVSGSIFKTDISQSQADLKNEREDKLSLDSMQLTGLNKFVFRDSKYTYKNVISNGSFEEGLWQTSVSDCYDYDNNPVLEMKLDTFEHSEGGQSLQLEAKRHIACTSQTFALERGTYLFNIDYQSPNAQAAYFYLKLNDAQGTVIQEKLLITDSGWHSHTELIDIPPGTSSATIYLYAHSADKLTNVINRYDNISLVRVPELRNTFYIINDPQLNLKDPASVTFDLVNPTKKLVHVRGATTPFYLAFSESFHPQWQLQLDNAKVHGFLSGWWPFARPDRVSDSFHFALDDFLNAWYVDPVELCGVAGSGAQVAPAYSDAIATQGSSGGGASSSFDFGLSTSSLTSYAPLPSSGFESVSSTLPVVLSPILLTIPGHSTTTISTSTPSTRVTLVPNAALRPGCTRNADGSYDIELVIEFWPQRWFYLGLLISATTLATCLSYLTFIGIRTLRRRLH